MEIFSLDAGVDHNGTPLPKVQFEGEQIGEAIKGRKRDYRWTEMRAWRTKSGKIVIQTKGCSQLPNEKTFYNVSVFQNIEEAQQRLGYSKLTARLWRSIGVETVIID